MMRKTLNSQISEVWCFTPFDLYFLFVLLFCSFAMASSFFFRSIHRLPLRAPGTFAAKVNVAAPAIRRFPSFSRIPIELGCCGASLFPFHSAEAAAKMTSRLSLASRSNRDISQCFLGYACRGP